MISYSLSFGAKSRCKHCLSGPKYLSYMLSGTSFRDIHETLRYFGAFQSMKTSVHEVVTSSAGLFVHKSNKLSNASVNISFASVKVRAHKNIEKFQFFNFVTCYSCECFQTSWLTRKQSIFDIDYITSRLSIKPYPLEIISL